MKLLKKSRKTLYIILGSISLVLGTLGIFLPLLPTTPFYLLTAWLYMRSSSKLYGRVMNNNCFGTVVRNFQEDKSIPLRTKIVIVAMLWITILLSAFLAVSVWWIRLLLFVVAIGITIHVLSYRTTKRKV
ncbi:MAG: YbaN family protein [Tannerellaceae bacterium]|nr:YbaN family protein [Tannerellaceae bacterium]